MGTKALEPDHKAFSAPSLVLTYPLAVWPLPLRGAVGDGVGSQALGGALGTVLAGWPEHQAVFNLLPLHWDWGASKLYMLFKTRVSVSYGPYNKPY